MSKANEMTNPVDAVVMRDLQWSDITYTNGFPANICRNSCVVVQIPQDGQGVVLYTCCITSKMASAYLNTNFNKMYTNDIYVFGA